MVSLVWSQKTTTTKDNTKLRKIPFNYIEGYMKIGHIFYSLVGSNERGH